MIDPAYEDKMDRLLHALEAFLMEGPVQHTHLENFFEVWRREEGITYNEFVDALSWAGSEALAADFDTLFWGEIG